VKDLRQFRQEDGCDGFWIPVAGRRIPRLLNVSCCLDEGRGAGRAELGDAVT
jgi:hypothetical protein